MRPLEVETNLSLQSNQSDKGAINSLRALMNAIIDLKLLQDGGTILLPQRIHVHLRYHDGNQAATCGQRGNGTHGNLHPAVNSVFKKKKSSQTSDLYVVCRKLNLLAIDERCKQYTNRAHVFLMRILSGCLSQLVVTVVQSVILSLT